tara:strand:+ start:228 stop:704 length:477 start_codon:yes stop_codon:yes gene_type:complete
MERRFSASDVERFLLKVKIQPGCWEWQASKKKFGYGQFGNPYHETAHRVAYEMFVGMVPDGKCVLHTCDNPSCVNPTHLWIGTQAENIADMMSKGRQRTGDVRGEKNGQARLRVEDVREIRRRAKDGETHRALAQAFGLSHSAVVTNIVNRKRWKSIV